ncbi:MAG: hypothetical protein ACOYEV_05115 [Candidatus Nanopelagicales bacterium]
MNSLDMQPDTLTQPAVAAPASARASRAVSWITASVALTVANAVAASLGWSWNFIFGMTWSYPIEDTFYAAGQTLLALVVGIALALPMLWIARQGRPRPRMMLLAATVFVLGALVSAVLYGDTIAAAGQSFIAVLAILAWREQWSQPLALYGGTPARQRLIRAVPESISTLHMPPCVIVRGGTATNHTSWDKHRDHNPAGARNGARSGALGAPRGCAATQGDQ